jgi:hypothetical protein
MGEYRRLRLDDMLESAAAWRFTINSAAAPHPLNLKVSLKNGKVMIRFKTSGFNTTNPIRLYRHEDFTGEDGVSLPVNQPVELQDPWPIRPNQTFIYEVAVYGDVIVGAQYPRLAQDRFQFRHPS